MRPFEPQSGETLVERPHYSAGNTVKQSDAVPFVSLKINVPIRLTIRTIMYIPIRIGSNAYASKTNIKNG